ncbi:MAG: zinc ribbon domain-containing protein [Thermoguttaceae bacterium]|nr:zinc ribbon domain-containing protein [Thermoguttaceae bacterium]MDW8077481.1 hypothetical protein [Thermoguttaceae bacterium]
MTEVILHSCPVCRTSLELDDLFCPNCGRESPVQKPPPNGSPSATLGLPTRREFSCEGCGASMSYDPSVQSLRCPYCGSVKIERRESQGLLRPDGVVPFSVDEKAVRTLLRTHLTKSWFSPGDLLREGTLVKIEPVYVPCWVFSAQTATQWTADVADVPLGANGTWRPVYGEHQGEYSAIFVPASRVLSLEEMDSLGNFDLTEAVGPEILEGGSAFVELFTIPRKYARSFAAEKIRRLEAETCRRKFLQAGHRNLNVNVTITHLSGRPYLVPVWVLAYRYRGKVFRFLVNGQTGLVTGRVPISWTKVTVYVLAAMTAIVAVAMLSRVLG